ncbi:MAG: hypothetical protein ACXAB7_14230 [Candidatus Kariarchaeaceae archaeon]
MSKKVSVRVELENEFVDMLNQIKIERMLTTNTDVIRYCLYEMTQAHNFRIEEDHMHQIKDILKREAVRKQYSIFSVTDFIKKALDDYITSIKIHSASIQNWDIRSSLNEEETEIALALIECQSESVSQEVQIQEILTKLNRKNEQRVRHILEKFVNRGILSSRRSGKDVFYHAKKM